MTGAPSPGPVKRSLTLSGHRTSVTLEAEFWEEFRRLADAGNISINALASRIDAERDPEVSLSSAIRVFVLRAALKRDPESGSRFSKETTARQV